MSGLGRRWATPPPPPARKHRGLAGEEAGEQGHRPALHPRLDHGDLQRKYVQRAGRRSRRGGLGGGLMGSTSWTSSTGSPPSSGDLDQIAGGGAGKVSVLEGVRIGDQEAPGLKRPGDPEHREHRRRQVNSIAIGERPGGVPSWSNPGATWLPYIRRAGDTVGLLENLPPDEGDGVPGLQLLPPPKGRHPIGQDPATGKNVREARGAWLPTCNWARPATRSPAPPRCSRP